jgi:hypothetical protein
MTITREGARTMAETDTTTLKVHPIADLFPLLEGDDLQALADDIKANGLHEAILVCQGEIIDGRNRLRACEIASVTPRFVEFTGLRADIPARIASLNLRRRHLTTQQRAAIAAEMATMGRGGDRKSDQVKASNDALTDAQAAKVMAVSEPTVERAKRRMRADPEAHAKAKVGTLGRVKARARKPKPIDGDREPKPKPTKPDLAELVATLNALWSPKDVERYEPTEQQLSMLKLNAPNVVRKLQSLALRFDYPVTSSGLPFKTAREIERLLAETKQPGEAPAEAEQAGAVPEDDLRDRLRSVLQKLDMSETRFAKHADMSQGTLNRYMLGIGKINQSNRAKIETALGDLAEYANAAPVGTGAALA